MMADVEFRSTGYKSNGANIYDVIVDGDKVGQLFKDYLPGSAIDEPSRFWVVQLNRAHRDEHSDGIVGDWPTAKEARRAIVERYHD